MGPMIQKTLFISVFLAFNCKKHLSIFQAHRTSEGFQDQNVTSFPFKKELIDLYLND